jgi:hypothetical protein
VETDRRTAGTNEGTDDSTQHPLHDPQWNLHACVEPSSNIILHLVMCYGYHIGVDGTARTFFSRHDEVKVSVSIIPAVSKLASSSWQPGRVKLSSERIQMDTASYRKTTCFTYVAVAYLSDPAVSVQYTYYIILFCFEKMCLSIYVR